MLYISPFEFIVRHFFWLLFAVMVIGLINGLFFFPVLLSLIGPAAELVPLEHPDRISTPTPSSHRNKRPNNKTVVLNNRSSSRSNKHHHKNVNLNNEPSLTTITEEPQSWKSSNSSISTGPPPEFNVNCANNNGCSHHQASHQQQQHHSSGSNSSSGHTDVKSIVVQPEVTVETTNNGSDQNSTKVTATANIRVELVTPGRSGRTYQHFSS